LQPANKKAEEACAHINNRLYAVTATVRWRIALVEYAICASARVGENTVRCISKTRRFLFADAFARPGKISPSQT